MREGDSMNIYFLNHSGFMLDDGIRCYVFDYFKDPEKRVDAMVAAGREMWFFVTHTHGDHYNPAILNFNQSTTRYIFHKDVAVVRDLTARAVAQNQSEMVNQTADTDNRTRINEELLTAMLPGETVTIEDTEITMFGSTDEGGSFLVKTPRDTFFHAGDLNWWHWLGDTPENIREAKDMAWRELSPLQGVTVDIGMFPVDNRLEDAMEWGIIEFLRRMTVTRAVIPMHLNGPRWKPSLYFKALFPDVPILNPSSEGEEFLNV